MRFGEVSELKQPFGEQLHQLPQGQVPVIDGAVVVHQLFERQDHVRHGGDVLVLVQNFAVVVTFTAIAVTFTAIAVTFTFIVSPATEGSMGRERRGQDDLHDCS